MKKHLFFTACLSLFLFLQVQGQQSLKTQLENLFPGSKIEKLSNKDHFTESYHIVLQQALDHKDSKAGTFEHHIYFSHFDTKAPMLLVTEGYSARNRTYELSKYLKTNQVIVEYRFYGKSRPNPIPWKYLTNDQAVEDYHSITQKLKTIYQNKWISTGISKGGETVMIYKSKYPKDIDVAVPYVAPLINGLEDERTTQLINSVGTEACRKSIREFQRAVLKNRDEVLKEMRTFVKEKKMTYTEVSIEEALEYATLEFPFSFWQWGGKCEEVPANTASPKELFAYLNKVVGVWFYSDGGYETYLPSFYQHVRELGYYGFDLEPVQDLLKVVKSSTNKRFAPKNVDLSYNPKYIKKVRRFIEKKGNQILYIYGEFDPWGACAPEPRKQLDALKMVLKGGHHGTRIRHLSSEDQQLIFDTLKRWLKE